MALRTSLARQLRCISAILPSRRCCAAHTIVLWLSNSNGVGMLRRVQPRNAVRAAPPSAGGISPQSDAPRRMLGSISAPVLTFTALGVNSGLTLQQASQTRGMLHQMSGAQASLLVSAACSSDEAPPSRMSQLPSAAPAPPLGFVPGSSSLWRRFSSVITTPQCSSYLPIEEPAQIEVVSPDVVPAVLGASHWITAQRGRSFKDRGLRVRVKARLMD